MRRLLKETLKACKNVREKFRNLLFKLETVVKTYNTFEDRVELITI